MILYQFAISHYCEKVRWVLDYKKISYEKKYCAPGPHIPMLKRIAPKTIVPTICDGDKVIQDSPLIIDYLEKKYPSPALSFPEGKKEIADWESFADLEIGIPIRLYFYSLVLPHKTMTLPMLASKVSSRQRRILSFFFPMIRFVIQKKLNINSETAKQAKEQLQRAIDKVAEHTTNRKFIVGDQVTRADIAVVSLLAPMLRLKKYDVTWPEVLPEEWQSFCAENKEKLSWVRNFYEQYR